MTTQHIKLNDDFNIMEYKEFYNDEMIIFKRFNEWGATLYEEYPHIGWVKREFHDNRKLKYVKTSEGAIYEFNRGGDMIRKDTSGLIEPKQSIFKVYRTGDVLKFTYNHEGAILGIDFLY